MRARVVLLAIVLAAVPASPARAAVPVLVVSGLGHGHGVGMAQDGALAMGRSGADLVGILGHFYPGAGLGAASGPVRVVVHVDDDADEVLTFPGGGELRSPRDGQQRPGFPVRVGPGSAVRVRFDGRYHVSGASVSARAASQPLPLPTSTTLTPRPPPRTQPPQSSTSTTASPVAPPPTAPTSTAPPGQSSDLPVWAVPSGDGTVGVPVREAAYRGLVEVTAAIGPLRLVNELDVEQYLRGMGEVRDPSWPAASLQAQAVVARTYALRAMAANGEICDTQRCQVYLGQQAEYGAMDQAVAASRGQVVVHGGRLASSVYSASGGGRTATPREGFGQPDEAHPYLVARQYETADPKPYVARIGLADLARRIGYPGDLTGVRVATTGPSGRALSVEIDGSAGVRAVPALELGRAVGARSTLWSLAVEQADAPPAPPRVGEELGTVQAPPDEVGGVLAGEAGRPDAADVEVAGPTGGDSGGFDVDWWLAGLLLLVTAGAVAGIHALIRI